MTTLEAFVLWFSLLVTLYFVLWNGSQFVMGAIAGLHVWRYKRRRNPRARALPERLQSPPLVSVIVPAFNESLTVIDCVRGLLTLDYEAREIIIVNDGSTDETMAVLQRTFQLVPAPLAFEQPLKTAPVLGVYRSFVEESLLVVDKRNGGGKADAANAGINAASGEVVLIIDADTVLESDALSRAALPFLENTDTVAVGGSVGVVNGCRVENGRITEVVFPRNWLARFQVVEYLRSFLLFRIATVSYNAVTLISGAFGLFRRSAVIEVGGYDHTAIGEDMDLTVRLQRFFRERGRPIRIAFVPYPLCWTQVPEDLGSLSAQRRRWRAGLLQVLWRYRDAIGNPRLGWVGMFALPHTAFFEGIGPLLEFVGYLVTTIAALFGLLSWEHFGVLLAASILFGTASTLLAVMLSDIVVRSYPGGRDFALIVLVALIENAGYRQLNSWWGCVGTIQTIAGRSTWGKMTRRAFDTNGPGDPLRAEHSDPP